jgi:hypothetical protein
MMSTMSDATPVAMSTRIRGTVTPTRGNTTSKAATWTRPTTAKSSQARAATATPAIVVAG